MLIHIAPLGLGIASTELPGASANGTIEASDTLTPTTPAAPDQERPRVRVYVGTVTGGALTVIGGTKMAITRGQQRRYGQADARNIVEEPAPSSPDSALEHDADLGGCLHPVHAPTPPGVSC